MAFYGDEYGSEYGGVPDGAEPHIVRAFARVLEQYRFHEDNEKLLVIFVARLQNIENVIIALEQWQLLDNATGWQLDDIGVLLQLARRPAWSTDDYRFYLRVRIAALRSKGTARDLLNVGRLLSGSPDDVRWRPEYPKAWTLTIPDVDPERYDIAAELVETASPAGFLGTLIFSSSSDVFAFRAPGSVHGLGAGHFGHVRRIVPLP